MFTVDFNKDLAISDMPGDIWSCLFTGSSVIVIAPKDEVAGNILFRLSIEPFRQQICPLLEHTNHSK